MNDTLDDILNPLTEELRADAATVGVLLYGSFVSGRMHAGSDVDVFCITQADWYSREIREVGGREVEIQWMPEENIRASFAEIPPTNHHFLLNAFTSGRILFERDGRLTRLVEEARQTREKGPPQPSGLEAAIGRVLFRRKLADVRRTLASDPGLARAGMTFLFYDALYAYCRTHRLWSSKLAHLLEALAREAPDVHALARTFLDATSDEARLAAVEALVRAAMEPFGWGEGKAFRMPRLPAGAKGRMREGMITW